MLEEAQKHYGRPGKARGDAVRTGTARRNMLATGIPPLARPCGDTARPAPDTALLADAAYGSRANVAECDRLGIDPLMRLKINSTAKGRGSGDAWGVAARRQLGGGPEEKIGGLTREERLENQRYRKSTVGYGVRWMAGIVISAIKRMFGEDVMALKWPNMVREVMLRVALYNRWIEEAAAA